MKKQNSVSIDLYSTLDQAFRLFNKKLFDNQLPETMITLQRKTKRNYGFFHQKRFVSIADVRAKKKEKKFVDEIALNPDQWVLHDSIIEIFQTLVHEMCHSWQRNLCEKQPRGGYHDKVWGRKMQEIGLMPSNTGKPGGKMTGQQMMDYIIENGKFEKAALQFLGNHKIDYSSFPLPIAAAKERNKSKYICPSCDAKVWGKPNMDIQCNDCDERYEEQ